MQYAAKAMAGPGKAISSPFPLQKPPPDLRFLNFLPLFFKGVFFHLGPVWNPILSDPQSILGSSNPFGFWNSYYTPVLTF